MLLIAAPTIVLLGPEQFWFLEQGSSPSPTVKKKCLSIFLGTFAGNLEFARLLNLLVNFAANEVSLKNGSLGLIRGSLAVLGFREGS